MSPRPALPNTRLRLQVVIGVLGLVAVVLVARAVNLQWVDREFYQRQGDARYLRELPIPTSRGMIIDRNGEPLAVSSPVESLWANPRELLPHPERLAELSAVLDIEPGLLEARLAQRADREFVYLRRHLSPEAAAAVLERGFPGVYSQREFRRFYPQGEVMAHVLGFTNIDDRGQEGLELAFDEWLSGVPGAKRVIRDRRGRIVENVDLIRAPRPGRDLRVSLDRRVQYLAYRELKRALLEHAAASGSVVILDVRSGEILAMVNQPSYNPNAREDMDPSSQRNRAVTDVFEPGSVMKTFTAVAALETGRYTPDSVFHTSPGFMMVAGHRVSDVRDFGTLSLTRMLTKSSNVVAAQLALDMPAVHHHDVLRRFGFGRPTGSGFPGEAAGVLSAPTAWGTLERATIGFGYGLSVTALQLAQAYAAIGNGGVLTTPSFLAGAPPQRQTVIHPDLAASVLRMLGTVTGPEGSARAAVVPGFRVAGKTGTSRRAVAGGYQKRYISLFAGLVPASAPRLAMVVVINDPQGEAYYGGLVAAPVFGRVMEAALRVLDVPPDDVQAWLAASPVRRGTAPAEQSAEALIDEAAQREVAR